MPGRISRSGLALAANATLLAAPICALQGVRLRRRLPLLPEAAGPRSGLVGRGDDPLHLLIFGESTAAGVGAPTQEQALAGVVARALAARLSRPIAWRVVGRSGLTAAAAQRDLIPQLAGYQPALGIIALGVNDVLRLRSARRWRNDLAALLAALHGAVGPVPLLVSGLPALADFPALPQPLRTMLALRARLLDQTTADLAADLPAVQHVPLPLPPDRSLYATDGFHPGPLGYARWGDLLAAIASDHFA